MQEQPFLDTIWQQSGPGQNLPFWCSHGRDADADVADVAVVGISAEARCFFQASDVEFKIACVRVPPKPLNELRGFLIAFPES